MQTKLLLICSLMLLSIIISCKDSSTSPNTSSTDIFPNKLGSNWIYAHHDSLSHLSDTLTVTIVGATTLSNNQSAMIWQYRRSTNIDTVYVFNAGDTVRFVTNTHSFRILFPLQIGSKWGGDYLNDTIRILQKAPISVVAGTFADSYEIQETWGGLNDYGQFTRWFVPNAGFVRIYHTGASFGMANETFELINYSIR